MSEADFILPPGFKQLEMLTPALAVVPCCSAITPVAAA